MKFTDLSNIDISNFLPHRKPMLMVSSVLEIEDTTVTTQFNITEDCVFLKNGYLSETGLIENAAQAASGECHQNRRCSCTEIYDLPKVNDVIVTKAKLISRFDTGEVTLCSLGAETYLDGKLIVSSTMNFLIHEV